MKHFRTFSLVSLMASLFAVSALMHEAAGQDGAPYAITVRIEGRKVVEPTTAVRVSEGDTVNLHWFTDETVELHLHGYDLELLVRPGEFAIMPVEANATGRFPITSHRWGEGGHGHEALIHLEVHPR